MTTREVRFHLDDKRHRVLMATAKANGWTLARLMRSLVDQAIQLSKAEYGDDPRPAA
jgi:hypothetical protein